MSDKRRPLNQQQGQRPLSAPATLGPYSRTSSRHCPEIGSILVFAGIYNIV